MYIFFDRTYWLLSNSFSTRCCGKGNITNTSNQPIEGVAIVLTDIKNTDSTIGYAITNGNGDYEITVKPQIKDSLLLIATHLNYEKVSKILTISASKTAYNLTLKEKSFNLEEIVIEIQKIKDTMAIKTDSLKLTERSTLRDILNKTEGFVVSEDGGITFRGKIIHKVLINKKEVFVNQNKIALDNLEYDMMNDIELINNYRDQYKIDFENFTETVINVNTRDEFKGIFKPSVEGAYGVKNKYQLNFRGLYFSDYLNAFITSNTNNIGKKSFSFTNISEEIKEQSSEFFKDHFTDFFAEDDLLAESFTSNSSITLRKENKKSRLGIVLYYNNLNQKKIQLRKLMIVQPC